MPNDPLIQETDSATTSPHCHKGNYRQISVPSFSDPSNVVVGSLSLYPHATHVMVT